MKQNLIIVALILLSFTSKGQLWQPLGPDNRDELGFGYSRLLWVKKYTDTLYAGLAKQGTNNAPSKFIFKKFNGSIWDTFGTPVSISGYSPAATISTCMDGSGAIYLAHRDTVKSMTNGVWSQVGNVGFAPGITNLSIKTGKADTPFVCYLSGGKVSVMKYNGAIWDSVGNRNFVTTASGYALGFDTTGSPYVAVADPTNLNRAVVMKYDGNSWITVSPFGGLSTLGAGNFILGVDSLTNDVYLHYQDAALGGVVKKYDGANWTSIGATFPSNFFVNDMCINKYGTPYINLKSSFYTWVVKYNGSSWIAVTDSTTTANNTSSTVASFSLSHDTIPILGHHYPNFADKPVVSVYDNSLWNKKGTYGFADDGIPKYSNNSSSILPNYLLITVTSNDIPHIVFSDSKYDGKLSLKKYVGGNWVYEGTPGFTSASAYPVAFEKAKNDTLIIMYSQTGTSGYKMSYYDGINFTNINSGLTNQTYPVNTAIDIDTAGIPYVLYLDPSNFNIATLKNYTNGNWNTLTTLPCTTAVQMKINSLNEVVAFYNGGANFTLAKYSNNTWTTIGSSGRNGLLKLAPNNSIFLLVNELHNQGGGPTNPISFYYVKRLNRLTSNGWSSSAAYYTTFPNYGQPPNLPESYSNVVFDTSSTPFIATVSFDSVSIKALLPSGGFTTATLPTLNWQQHIKAANFDMAFTSNNELIAAYSQGTAYALGLQLTSQPPPPQTNTTLVTYCQGDTANALTAIGQNLKWYPPNSSTPSTPIPSTAVADTFVWRVTQTDGIYESLPDSVTVIVHPRPTITIVSGIHTICAGDTTYLTTPATSAGAIYHWTHIQNINGTTVTSSYDSTNTIPVVDSGVYFVKVTPEGCSSDSVRINVLPILQPSITITGPATAIKTTPTFITTTTISNIGSYDYFLEWYINGVFFTATYGGISHIYYDKGVGNDTIFVVIKPLNTLTTSCLIPTTSNSIIIAEEIVSVNDINKTDEVSVVPNPFSNEITINSLKEEDQILLIDIMGKIVRHIRANDTNSILNTENISAGYYIVRILDKDGSVKKNIPVIKK